MRAFVISACVVFAAACSNNPGSSDTSGSVDSGGGIDSGTKPDASNQVDSGSKPDASAAVDSGPGIDSGPVPPDAGGPIFYGAGDAGTFTSGGLPALLVDNDNSDNNNQVVPPAMSPSDQLFASVLQGGGIPYNQWVIPADNSGDSRPNATDLTGVSLVLWYTGSNNLTSGNGVMSAAQESALATWLNGGGKSLVIFSENFVSDMVTGSWTAIGTEPLLTMLGAIGAQDNPSYAADAGTADIAVSGSLPFYTVAGNGPGLPAGSMFFVFNSAQFPINPPNLGILNLGPLDGGVDTNGVVLADPTLTGSANVPAAVVVTNKKAGTAGTSTLVFVGFPVEDIFQAGGQGGTLTQFFTALGVYLGL